MTIDLRIDGARVVTPDEEPTVQTLAIDRGAIIGINSTERPDARRVIDASGLVALPGIIDTHVHVGFTDTHAELVTDTQAAVRAGVTTALIYYRSTESYDELLPEFISEGLRASCIDFGVHLGILHDQHLRDLPRYVETFGLRSIKMYLTYKHGELRKFGVVGQDDGFICDVFRAAAELDGLLVHVHCENDDLAERGAREWLRAGDPAVKQWDDTRPALAEVEAIRRMGLFAREFGNRLFIPHLSSPRGLEAALEEQQRGARISMETCPQYLWAELLADAGTLAKVNPPVRWATDSTSLWQGLRDGQIDVVGTDHAALRRQDKVTDVLSARPGFPGMGTLLPALLLGVQRGRLRLTDIAAIQRRAARVFDLPSKGELRVGGDADVVLIDPDAKQVMNAGQIGGVSDFTPFEGVTLCGPPAMTLQRGKVLVEDGQFVGQEGDGEYVRQLAARTLVP